MRLAHVGVLKTEMASVIETVSFIESQRSIVVSSPPIAFASLLKIQTH